MSGRGDESAMPWRGIAQDVDGEWGYNILPGLTKRELFVALAMQGLCVDYGRFHSDEELAETARNVGDAQLAALDATPEGEEGKP